MDKSSVPDWVILSGEGTSTLSVTTKAALTPPKPSQYVLVWTDNNIIHGKAVNIRRENGSLCYDLVFEPRTFNIVSYLQGDPNDTKIVPKVTIDNSTPFFTISNVTSSHVTIKRKDELGIGKNGKGPNDWAKEEIITLSIPEGNKTINQTVRCVIDNESELQNH